MSGTHRHGARSTSVRHVVDGSGDALDQATAAVPRIAENVSTIMTRSTVCVRPDVGIDALATLLLEHRVSGMPVVDGDGRPVGIVSKTDLLRHLHEHPAGLGTLERDEAAVLAELGAGFHAVHVDGTTVGDIMMPMVFAIRDDISIAQAAALMAGEGIHRLPILDGAGAVCGILSAFDIVRWVAAEAGYPV